MEGTSLRFKNDVHYQNGLSCADCHGGDPGTDDANESMSASRGFKVRVTRDATSEYCARCHADAAVIHEKKPGQRTDQFELYKTSVHAAIPPGGDSVAANCVDCHGVHDIRAVDDVHSPVSPQRLAATCGKCHSETEEVFNKSVHGSLFVTSEMPSCDTCHAPHATQRASTQLLAGGRSACMKCHEPDSKGGMTAASLERAFDRALMAMISRRQAAGPNTGAPSREGQVPGRRRGGFFSGPGFQKARIAVHSLDVAAVRAALAEATAVE
jgi:predicted CXXCH cytochrome family protein